MMARGAGVLPIWEDFSAFGDTGELDHVCELFEVATDEEWGDVSGLAGDNSALIKRLVMQDTASRDLLEGERPGLYSKTWMAHLMRQLYLALDQITEKPYLLPGELPGLLLNFHKVLIAAHEIYDPAHRAKLVAEAACEAASGAIANRNKAAAKKSRASKGITAAIQWALNDGHSSATKTAEQVWRKLAKYDQADALECGDFSVFVRDDELMSVYRGTGKNDGRPIKKASFGRAFARAKKVLP